MCSSPIVEVTRVAAKGGLEIRRVEGEEEIAQGVHGRSTPEVSTKDGVQALPVHAHEGDDALVRGRPRQHGQDREQKQMGQRIAPALRAARVLDLVEGSEQGSERHHGGLHQGGRRSTRSLSRWYPQPPSFRQAQRTAKPCFLKNLREICGGRTSGPCG